MLDMNITVVDDSQYFTAIIKYKHSDTEPIPQVDLDYNILQCNKNKKTNMKCHKNTIPGREYLCFQTDNKY